MKDSTGDLLNRFLENISDYCGVHKGERIVLGCSGGADSVAMLHLFWRAVSLLQLELYVCHINYQLRGEASDADENLVQKYCKKLKLPLTVHRVELSKEYHFSNLEETLREMRYHLFSKQAELNGCRMIAVAHNKNDQAETLLLNLIRGAGTEGLSAMTFCSNLNVIRPMLNCSRNEIIVYLKNFKLAYREDETNYGTTFTRNKIRNLLLPFLESEFNPNIIDILYHTSLIIRDEAYIAEEIGDTYMKMFAKKEKYSISFPVSIFFELSQGLKRKILRLMFKHCAQSTRKLHFIHIESILKQMDNEQARKEVHLPCSVTVRMTKENILLYLKDFYGKINKFEYKIKIPSRFYVAEADKTVQASVIPIGEFKELKADKSVSCLDWSKCAAELILRNRREGDIFKAFGSPGKKKIKDYLISKKIPRDDRDALMLVVSNEQIACILGIEINDDFKVTSRTKKILCIRISDE